MEHEFKVGTILAYSGSYVLRTKKNNHVTKKHFTPHFSFFEIRKVEDKQQYVCKRIFGRVQPRVEGDLEDYRVEDYILKCIIKPCTMDDGYYYYDKGTATFSSKDQDLSVYNDKNVYTAFRYTGDDSWGVSLL
jgi:hypothetical protein